MNSRNVWFITPCVFIAIIAILVCGVEALKRQAENRPFGRLTPKDIQRRMQDLTRVSLLPGDADVSVNQLEFRTREVTHKKSWSVDYSGRAGEFAGHAQWDADTGELMLLSRKMNPSCVIAPDVTRSEALGHAWRLLRQPGIANPGEGWFVDGSPRLHGEIWHVSAHSSARRADLKIDRHLDSVTYLHVIPRPIRTP